MKKLLILAAVLVAGVAANAASFKWTASNIYGADGATKFRSRRAASSCSSAWLAWLSAAAVGAKAPRLPRYARLFRA